eukprot:scaffold19245_cov199-Amphora_coffeaeformis.AAC.34
MKQERTKYPLKAALGVTVKCERLKPLLSSHNFKFFAPNIAISSITIFRINMKLTLALSFIAGTTAFAPLTNKVSTTVLEAASGSQFADSLGVVAPTGEF